MGNQKYTGCYGNSKENEVQLNYVCKVWCPLSVVYQGQLIKNLQNHSSLELRLILVSGLEHLNYMSWNKLMGKCDLER